MPGIVSSPAFRGGRREAFVEVLSGTTCRVAQVDDAVQHRPSDWTKHDAAPMSLAAASSSTNA